MRFFTVFYTYFRILSLDVVLGAVLMCYFCAYCLDTHPDWSVYVSLGVAVWLIYTLDHLLDAYKIPHEAHTSRHRFHQKHFNILSICWLISLIFGLWITLNYLPRRVLIFGMALSSLVFLHFLLTLIDRLKNTLLIQKETRIAFIYSLGVALASLSLKDQFPNPVECLIIFQIFLIAWVNLLIISYYEEAIDQKDAHVSTARKLGKSSIQSLIQVLLLIQWVLAFYCGFTGGWRMIIAILILCLMNVILALIAYRKKYFQEKERYRALSDAIFFLPLVLLGEHLYPD